MVSRLLAGALSILIGLLLTWGMGMFPTPFAQIQIDVVSYGASIPYVHRVIPTQFLSYDWLNFALDIAARELTVCLSGSMKLAQQY